MNRRSRGTGSVFRKPGSQTWTIQFYNCGRRVRVATHTSNRTAALQQLRARLVEVDRREYRAEPKRAVRVEDLFQAMLLHTQVSRPGSVGELRRRWAHLSGPLGLLVAGQVTTADVDGYILQRQQAGAANATINRELGTLRRMYRLGLRSSPPQVRAVPYIHMLKESNARQGFVEDEDYAKLCAVASPLWLRLLLELAYTYGWRKGELLGLRCRNVNLALRTIRLDPGTTKNGDGRQVVMTSRVADLLVAAVRGKGAEAYVLTREDGSPVRDLRKAWRALVTAAGLPGLLLHDLRRSAAKALRRAGVPESVVMQTGGWKTRAMFERYAIVSQADQQAAMVALERERARAANSPQTAPISSPAGRADGPAATVKVQ